MVTPLRRLGRFRLATAEIKLIEHVLAGDNPVAKKHALQRLCGLLRRGYRLTAPRSTKALVILNLQDADAKVRRWCFNTLAMIGAEADVPFMETAWKQNFNEPDVFQAGLTALAHLVPKEELLPLLSRSGVTISPEVIMGLAQESAQFDEEVRGLVLNPDKASARELRSATLLVGLEKAPPNLFSPRHPVESVIGVLNTHDDPIVSQYSFWATVEHANLTIDDVRVPPQLFSQLPPNVQAWSYRVLTQNVATAKRNNDFIFEGSQSDHLEVRQGVALGLRDIFYDSLDVTVIDWMLEEKELVVREKLLEHMAAQSEHSPGYCEEVESAYRGSGAESSLRARLEAACYNTGLAMTLKKIALQTGEPDLYTQIAGNSMTNTQNFNAPVNVGGISNTGTGSTGDVTIIAQQTAVADARVVLEEILSQLEKIPQSKESIELRGIVEAAVVEPKSGLLTQVTDKLKMASDGVSSLATLGGFAASAYEKLQPLIALLPG